MLKVGEIVTFIGEHPNMIPGCYIGSAQEKFSYEYIHGSILLGDEYKKNKAQIMEGPVLHNNKNYYTVQWQDINSKVMRLPFPEEVLNSTNKKILKLLEELK